MRISDWSSDVCSSDLLGGHAVPIDGRTKNHPARGQKLIEEQRAIRVVDRAFAIGAAALAAIAQKPGNMVVEKSQRDIAARRLGAAPNGFGQRRAISVPARASDKRSEEHTSELQSLMRISYAVFCLKKKKHYIHKEIQRTKI